MTTKKAIQLKNVFFDYEKNPILERASFSINSGEFVGIFGPNGGGKTTLLKLLMGFIRPSQGSIEILGQPPFASQKKIGYVPQASSFDRQFPISTFDVVLMGDLKNLSRWGFYSRESKKSALRALKKVGLISKKNQPFGTLSGGEAQRVLIARAIVSNPEILLLDEPTASIDIEAERLIYNLLLELKGSMTIVMVTHDLESVIKKADRLLCVQKQVSTFSPEEVCDHFALGLYHPPLRKKS